MGKREVIIEWFEDLNPSERAAVLNRLAAEEKAQLRALLDGAEPLEARPSATAGAPAQIDRQRLVERKLAGAPEIFLRLHRGEAGADVPPRLRDAVAAELERLDAESATGVKHSISDGDRSWPTGGLFDTAKTLWHRFSRMFS